MNLKSLAIDRCKLKMQIFEISIFLYPVGIYKSGGLKDMSYKIINWWRNVKKKFCLDTEPNLKNLRLG